MSEKEALKLYLPYKRKSENLTNEMEKEGFVDHVKLNKDYYMKNHYVWNTTVGGDEVPIKPHMPLKLVGFMQQFIFSKFSQIFPQYVKNIITKNGRMMRRFRSKVRKKR